MFLRRARFKAGLLAALLMVLALWATVAIAGVNKDFMEAAAKADLSEVKSLLAKGADVNAKDNEGVTALMMADQYKKKKIMQLLIKAGAK